jgi:hypothetical protein
LPDFRHFSENSFVKRLSSELQQDVLDTTGFLAGHESLNDFQIPVNAQYKRLKVK